MPKRIIRLALVVCLIAAIHVGAGQPSANNPSWTWVKARFPNAARMDMPSDPRGAAWILDSQGRRLAALVCSEGLTDSIHGFGGPTPLIVALDLHGRITDIQLLPNSESEDFVAACHTQGLLEHWIGLPWREAGRAKVDVVSGATLTSSAIIRTLQARLALLEKKPPALAPGPASSDLGVMLVIAAALLVNSLKIKAKSAWRVVVLISSVAVLGFMYGTFLSVSLFAGWIKSGIPWPWPWGISLMAVLAVGFSLFFKRPFYCTWLCPFGAAQELLGRWSPWQRPLPAVVTRWLTRFRTAWLLILAGLVLGRVGLDLTYAEPFTFFLLRHASAFTIILASLFLLLSLRIMRPWCRSACPTGALLDMLR